MVCGTNTIHEEAYCYTDGSKCEKWYKEGKSLRHAETYEDNDILGSSKADLRPSKVAKGQGQPEQCGVQPVTGPFSRPTWALRIIGKSEKTDDHFSPLFLLQLKPHLT
jgi:hypothetical protein